MRHGFPIRYYKKLRERNEALDCRVFNLAALEILNPNFERLAKHLKTEKKPVEENKPLPDNGSRNHHANRAAGLWMRGGD